MLTRRAKAYSIPVHVRLIYEYQILSLVHPSLSFSALVRGDPLRIYGKALRFLKLESSSFQAADGEDLVILACTVFD